MTDIPTAYQNLDKAQGGYDAAAITERSARAALTEALNGLNAAQKEFDEALADLKRNAPRDSDWKRPTGVLIVEH